MKKAYPVIMTRGKNYIVTFVPDFEINSQGEDYADAIEMARDAIGIVGLSMEDAGEPLPAPSDVEKVKQIAEDGIVTLVDVDFTAYRRQNEQRTVRRNVSLPSWLNDRADKAGLNVSAVLQTALKRELKID